MPTGGVQIAGVGVLGDLQERLARDLQAFQAPFGFGQLRGELGDLLAQPVGQITSGRLPGLNLFQQFSHVHPRSSGIVCWSGPAAGHSRAVRWWRSGGGS